MAAVEGVDVCRGAVEVGEEGVMAPVRPQPALGGVGEPGAAHDEATTLVGRLRHLGQAAGGVVDVGPGVVVNGGDRLDQRLVPRAHGHRVAHIASLPEAEMRRLRRDLQFRGNRRHL